MKDLMTVVQAKYDSEYRIRLRFRMELRRLLISPVGFPGEVFEPLREKRAFRRFFLSGGTVCWSNNADIAPETL